MTLLSRRASGALLAVIAVMAAVCAPVMTATAASNGQTSFAPSDAAAGTPRPFFVYTLNPGGTIHDTAVLENATAKAATFDLYATDASDVNGAFSLSSRKTKAIDVGAWATLSRTRVTVPAHSKKNVGVDLTVPLSATPGDHAGGFVALPVAVVGAGAGGNYQIGARYGVGIRIYLRVGGPTQAQLTVTDMKLNAAGGATGPLLGHDKATLTYTVENTGNVRLEPTARVTFSTHANAVTVPLADLGEMLPGSSTTKTVSAEGLQLGSLLGVVHAEVTIAAPDAPAVVTGVSTPTVPWLLLLVVLGCVVGGVLLTMQLRRVRRRRNPPAPTGASADELVGA